MNELNQLEVFEIEILDWFNSKGYLRKLIFGGGTMLRLCYDLPRFSVDMDFWTYKVKDFEGFFKNLEYNIGENFELTDSAFKFYIILFELRKKKFVRKLKIEIRKSDNDWLFQDKIAFSRYANIQVLVRAFTLEQMLDNKIAALIGRKEIRDAFDIEFILKKGLSLNTSKKNILKIEEIINGFKQSDYNVTLGSLLESDIRRYYSKNNFEYLMSKISENIQ